jgi:hypothetical protein
MHRDIVESAGVWGRLDDIDNDLTAEHKSFNQCRKLASRMVLLVSLNALHMRIHHHLRSAHCSVVWRALGCWR